MRGPAPDLRALLHIPKRDLPVLARAREHAGHECERRARDLVAGQRVEWLRLRAGLPHFHAAIAVRGREIFSIRAVRDRRDPLGVLFDQPRLFAVLRVENFHLLVRPAERDELLIRADVRREHRVRLVAHGADALARGHVPHHDLAEFSAEPAARDEQLRIPRKAERVRKSLGEGEHADAIQRLRVVKQHLPLPADRHERRPRARRHRDDRIVRARFHKRLHRQIARHRRRAVRLRERHDCHVHLVRGDRRRLAVRIFEREARDPRLQQRHVALGKRVALWRHLRIAVRLADFVNEAAVRIAGLDHRAVLTARDRRLIRREIEARLLLVGVVAVRAGVPENRRNLIGVGHLRLGKGSEAQAEKRGGGESGFVHRRSHGRGERKAGNDGEVRPRVLPRMIPFKITRRMDSTLGVWC